MIKMKTKQNELDVDFIGGQGELTSEEEKALSDYFKKQKLKASAHISSKKQNSAKRVKVAA